MLKMNPMRLTLALIPVLAACATTPPPAKVMSPDGIARAALGERVYVDGPHITPLEVLEDSRCPIDVRCVWAGRTRISIRIDLGSRSEVREIATDKPIQVADGTLSLVEVKPDRARRTQPDEQPYRFGFRFAGGY